MTFEKSQITLDSKYDKIPLFLVLTDVLGGKQVNIENMCDDYKQVLQNILKQCSKP